VKTQLIKWSTPTSYVLSIAGAIVLACLLPVGTVPRHTFELEWLARLLIGAGLFVALLMLTVFLFRGIGRSEFPSRISLLWLTFDWGSSQRTDELRSLLQSLDELRQIDQALVERHGQLAGRLDLTLRQLGRLEDAQTRATERLVRVEEIIELRRGGARPSERDMETNADS
jgi:hypothetical protein